MAQNEPDKDGGSRKNNLINETITGRRMTPGRLLRQAFTAIFCGIIFGLSAACVFLLAGNNVSLIRMAEEESEAEVGTASDEDGSAAGLDDGTAADGLTDERADLSDEAGPGADETAEAADGDGISGNPASRETGGADGTDSVKVPAGTDGMPDDESSVTRKERDASPEEGSLSEEAGTDAPTDPEEGDSDTVLTHEYADSDSLINGIARMRKEAAELIDRYIVKVSAISSGTTWFESVVTSSTDYSGLIIDIGESELLILTTAEAAGAEQLKVTFSNHVTVDAYVKQVSRHDSLAVLAVSSVNGMDENMLDGMEGIVFAEDEDIYVGEPVIASGAPLGVVGSHAYGDIGYIDDDGSDYDVSGTIIYADIAADISGGTFIMDYHGRLLGAASGAFDSVTVNSDMAGFVSASSLADTVESLKSGKAIAYLGIEGVSVSFDMLYNGVPEGVYVTGIEVNSPAYSAGIARGDIICRIDDTEISSMDGLCTQIRKHDTNQQINVTVKRSGADGAYSEISFELATGER